MINVFIGIDGGLDGGIVALSPTGEIIGIEVMPTVKRTLPARKKSKTGKPRNLREIDPIALISIIDQLAPNRAKAHVTFEECPEHGDRASILRGMGIGAGIVIACLKIKGFNHSRILSHDWQPEILGKVAKGQTKERANFVATQRWPKQTWPQRAGANHDGCVDAAMIALFGRLKNL